MLHSSWPEGTQQQWRNFTEEEVACKCGCGSLPEPVLMRALQDLRKDLGFPLPISSGARCPDHNERVSKTGRDGPHTTGLAVDIAVRGEEAWKLLQFAMAETYFTGIGVHQKGAARFIHLDMITTEGRPWVWSY